jgi:hypothetical protein
MNTENNTDAQVASRPNRVRPPKSVVKSKLVGGFASSSKTMARLRARYRNYRPTCSPQSLYILRGNSEQVPLPQTISVERGKLAKSGTELSDYISSNPGQHSEQSKEILLLMDIHNIFHARNISKLRTKNLLSVLWKNKLWTTYCSGKKINARRLSNTLRREFGIHSKDIRFKAGIFKGFYRKTIAEACRRFNVA